MTTSTLVLRAVPTDAATLAGLIATAFQDLAVTHWLVPDPCQRRGPLRGHIQLAVEHALGEDGANGHVDMTPDRTAVAVWRRTDGAQAPPTTDYEQRLHQCCGPHTNRFLALDTAFDAHHPDTMPHHHLAFLAVHPDHQRRGLGTRLLRHHHRWLDQHGVGAVLHASSENVRRLCTREGYRVIHSYDLPVGGPPMVAMWREPRPCALGIPERNQPP